MSVYSIPLIIGVFLGLSIGVFVYFNNRKSEVNIAFFLFTFFLSLWLFSYAIAYSVKEERAALFWCKLACTAVAFTAPTFYHLAISLLGIKKERILVYFSYFIMVVFALLFRTDYFLRNEVYKYYWGYYSKAGILHPFYLLVFLIVCSRSLILIWNAYIKKEKGYPLEALRLKYIFIAYFLAVLGFVDYLPKYGLRIYPFGWVFCVLFVIVSSYAILKHRLMDIRVAITRAVIFIFVYSLVFAIPIWLGIATKWWLFSMVLMGVLSPIGMFTYSYLREQLEGIMFREQQKYQAGIRALAKRMLYVDDIDTLFREMVKEVYKVVKPQFIGLYVLEGGLYRLSGEYFPEGYDFEREISPEASLVKLLLKIRRPCLAEHARYMVFPLETMVVPFFHKDKLEAFLVLGQKSSKMMYSESDFVVFDILSSQVSLGIENIRHLEELNQSQLELLKRRRMEFVGLLVRGLAHELLNPLTPLLHRIEDLEEVFVNLYGVYEKVKEKEDNPEFKNMLISLCTAPH